MRDCERLLPKLVEVLVGENLESDELTSHLNYCVKCRNMLTLHRSLALVNVDQDKPDGVEFAQLRASVLRKIRTSQEREPVALMLPIWRWLSPALLSITTLLIGVWIGVRLSPEAHDVAPPFDLLHQIRRDATANRHLAQSENSKFSYGNVSFANSSESQMKLGFDVTIYIEAETGRNDPLLKEVLVQTLLNPMPMHHRLKAIAVARNHMDGKVKQALIFALHNDAYLPVRLKAMSLLAELEIDEAGQRALLTVLRQEENVQIRLIALDCLMRSPLPEPALENLFNDIRHRQDQPLVARIGML